MHHVVLHVLGAEHQVADQLRVRRHGDAQRVLDRAHRGQRVHRRAHAADALAERPGVARVAALEDDFEPRTIVPALQASTISAVLHLRLDAEVALDAGDGITTIMRCHHSWFSSCLSRPWRCSVPWVLALGVAISPGARRSGRACGCSWHAWAATPATSGRRPGRSCRRWSRCRSPGMLAAAGRRARCPRSSPRSSRCSRGRTGSGS